LRIHAQGKWSLVIEVIIIAQCHTQAIRSADSLSVSQLAVDGFHLKASKSFRVVPVLAFVGELSDFAESAPVGIERVLFANGFEVAQFKAEPLRGRQIKGPS